MKYLIRLTGMMLILMLSSWAYGHGTSLKINKQRATPGETISVKGQGVGSNTEITLTLQGMTQDYPLGAAQGDDHGVFEKQLVLPGDIRAGNYTLVASAGSQKATAKLAVQESTVKPLDSQDGVAGGEQQEHLAGKSGHGDAEKSGEHSGADMQEAMADPMEIQRSTTTAEKAVAWVMVLVSALLGISLLVRDKRQ